MEYLFSATIVAIITTWVLLIKRKYIAALIMAAIATLGLVSCWIIIYVYKQIETISEPIISVGTIVIWIGFTILIASQVWRLNKKQQQ